MKRILLIAIIGAFAFTMNLVKVQAQVTVAIKPHPPEIKMPLPQKPGPDYTLIPGHWIWHRPSKMYAWLGPRWVPNKENRKWAPGHWSQIPNGWKWIPAHWEKTKKKQYFFK